MWWHGRTEEIKELSNEDLLEHLEIAKNSAMASAIFQDGSEELEWEMNVKPLENEAKERGLI